MPVMQGVAGYGIVRPIDACPPGANRGGVGEPGESVSQAAEKGPSMVTHLRWVPPRLRGAATYGLSTPRASDRAAPCIWDFLSSLGKTSLQHPARTVPARTSGGAAR